MQHKSGLDSPAAARRRGGTPRLRHRPALRLGELVCSRCQLPCLVLQQFCWLAIADVALVQGVEAHASDPPRHIFGVLRASRQFWRGRRQSCRVRGQHETPQPPVARAQVRLRAAQPVLRRNCARLPVRATCPYCIQAIERCSEQKRPKFPPRPTVTNTARRSIPTQTLPTPPIPLQKTGPDTTP